MSPAVCTHTQQYQCTCGHLCSDTCFLSFGTVVYNSSLCIIVCTTKFLLCNDTVLLLGIMSKRLIIPSGIKKLIVLMSKKVHVKDTQDSSRFLSSPHSFPLNVPYFMCHIPQTISLSRKRKQLKMISSLHYTSHNMAAKSSISNFTSLYSF